MGVMRSVIAKSAHLQVVRWGRAVACRMFFRQFCAVQIMLLCCSSLLAQELSCGGVNPDPGPLGYKERFGDARCEGLYRSPVAGFALELLSLTLGSIDFQLRSNATLYVAAPNIGPLKADKVNLQARALPLRTYYRMDATVRSGAIFKWPMSLLHPAKLSSELIGVVGWVDQSAKIYIPISVYDGKAPSGNTSLVIVFRSTVDVEKLFWRKWPKDKNAAATAWENTRLAYRAGQPIRLELQAAKGALFVEVSAKTTGSDDWANIVAQVYQP